MTYDSCVRSWLVLLICIDKRCNIPKFNSSLSNYSVTWTPVKTCHQATLQVNHRLLSVVQLQDILKHVSASVKPRSSAGNTCIRDCIRSPLQCLSRYHVFRPNVEGLWLTSSGYVLVYLWLVKQDTRIFITDLFTLR